MIPSRVPKYALWAALTVPACIWLGQASLVNPADWEELLHPTGELSALLLIAALALTPLLQLFPASAVLRWLVRNRRALGVAAFGYAALHTALYIGALGNLEDILAEALAIGIWPGWAALALMLPLAATSTDAAMRRLKSGWKRLQRLAYPAAMLTLVHWIFIHNNTLVALAHFAPLACLEAWRITRRFTAPKGLST
ncbi:MAG: ferric reductase-like transmembrane domain-containing protein [Sandaracinobacteroides sp.]